MKAEEAIRAMVLREVLECDDPALLDLIYKIMVADKEEGRAD